MRSLNTYEKLPYLALPSAGIRSLWQRNMARDPGSGRRLPSGLRLTNL